MRLLVVEDEARLARALQKGLRAEGFAVDLAHDGRQRAATRPAHGDYDAMVLDVMLPRLSGYGVVRTLRAEQNWVPVLMLSAKDGEYDQADGLDVGADDYLTKPFSYVVLLARLRALLRRGAPERPAVLDRRRPGARPGGPAGRPRRRRRGGADRPGVRPAGVPDAPRRRGGRRPSCWTTSGSRYGAAEANVVEVYIGYLRRKIDRRSAGRRETTVRGAGYRLEPDGG